MRCASFGGPFLLKSRGLVFGLGKLEQKNLKNEGDAFDPE
jgi:hypothetical protein